MKQINCNFNDWSWPFYIHDNGDYLSRKLEGKTHGGPGVWEPVHTAKVIEVLEKGDYALDIGANMGWYTTVMSKAVGETGRVIAIEPSVENYEVLTSNISLNNLTQATAINKAAGDTKKRIVLTRPKETNYGDSRIYNPGDSHESVYPIDMTDVDTLLDELNIEKEKIKFIKIDCQGAEPFILKGMQKTIEALTSGSSILLEIWPAPWAHQNISVAEVFSYVKDKFDILNDDMKTPLTWSELESLAEKGYSTTKSLRGFDVLLTKR